MSTPIKRKKKKGKLFLQEEDFSKLTTKDLIQKLIEAREDLIKKNNILKEKQLRNEKQIEGDDSFNFLYPHQDDPNFNSKIMSKKEFNDIIHEKKERPIDEYSDEICNKKIFELLPHQLFVRNYLSFNTPYNSILMFHGLGSGKTCSSITITEMMRSYLNQLGVTKRIIIVASPNVQTNFRTQLFDERRLEEVNGIWNLNACTGNKFIKEINPMSMKGLSRKDVIKLIKRIINKSYLFLGQEQFANYIASIVSKYTDIKKQKKYLKHEFSNRMIVIDEVHNIRITTDNPSSKKISKQLMFLVENTDNLKLLLLTATPMFNNNTEIIWLLNLMNANDNRPIIKTSDVFDKDNNLIVGEDGTEIGKELLIRKSRSYVSYMRGENPYFFPFKITPSMFLTNNTITQYNQPDKQMNDVEIVQPIQYLDLYYTRVSPYQQSIYSFVIEHVKEQSKKKGIGYQLLTLPLQCLTMAYPNVNFDTKLEEYIEDDDDDEKIFELPELQMMVGKRGLSNTMRYDSKTKRNFEYKQDMLKKYGRIFGKDNIGKYSSKISFITKNALQSDGVILIYSQYIDGGCIPIALALEELGFSRYGKKNNLFNVPPPEKTEYSYAMVTGDILLSPNNAKEINACTSDDNKNGDIIKVLIISEAGSEGIDLKFIRQVHIIDPWYNLGRIEQITGRAIRNCSHKILPLKERNVEVYMHASELVTTDIESADVYLYRISEYKAIKIGEVTRILKESAVDCLVNKDIKENLDTIDISLSSKKTLKYTVGDLSYGYTCDYMRNCNYECNAKVGDISLDTYNDTYITLNNDIIINRIKELFKEGYVFSKADIIGRINYVKNYPLIQINSALSRLVNDNSEFVYDYYNNTGKIINIGLYYLYQPINIETKQLSMYERMNPPQRINKKVRVLLKDDIIQKETNVRKLIKTIEKNINYSLTFKETLLKEKDLNWYKAAGKFFNNRNIIKIDKDLYLKFVVRHYFDTVDIESKLQLFNYLLSKPEKDMTDIERLLSDVMKEYIMLTQYVVIADPKINNLSYFTIKDNVLVESKPTEKERIIKQIIKTRGFNLNDVIGFMGNFKKKYSVFKIKNTKNVRDTGFRADQKGKLDILKMLNMLTDNNDIYTYENTRKISNSKELCIDQEILFRYYHETKKDTKHWFLSQENFIINSYLSKK